MTEKTAAPIQGFDAEAFGAAFDTWIVEKGNRQKLSDDMQPALREARRMRHSLEVKPERMAQAVAF